MQKNNYPLSKSTILILTAIVAFVNVSCSIKVSSSNNLVIPLLIASSNDTAYLIFMRYIWTGRDARTTRVLKYCSVPHLPAKCCKTSPLRIGVLPTQNFEEQHWFIKVLEGFKVIWESLPIPLLLIMLSKKLSPDTIKKLKTSFFNIPEIIENIYGGQSAGYTSIKDGNYAPIHRLQAKLNLETKVVR